MIDGTKKEGVRINKFISDSGYCSRREADNYIQTGRVHINKRVAVLGDTVVEGSDRKSVV